MFNKKKKNKYDFYLAGPMRGYVNLNKDVFTLAARILRSKGFTVWSPSEHADYIHFSFAECMSLDLNNVINNCRKIVFLSGWKKSVGANIEALVAFACNKEAFEIIFDKEKLDIELIQLDLSDYYLPYGHGYSMKAFNPHL